MNSAISQPNIQTQIQTPVSEQTVKMVDLHISDLKSFSWENVPAVDSSLDVKRLTITKQTEGKGELTFTDERVIKASMSAGVFHGPVSFTDSEGIITEATCVNGKLVGPYALRFPSGIIFKSNKLEDTSRSTIEYPNGDRYEGSTLDFKRHGEGTLTKKNGSTYIGSWFSDQRHGYGCQIYSNGEQYKGIWSANSRHGPGIYVYANGDSYDGLWSNDVKQGEGLLKDANGKTKYFGNWLGDVPYDALKRRQR